MNKLITKFGIALLLGGAILSGCSEEEEEEDSVLIDAASFFKVTVSSEDYTEGDQLSRSAETPADTIITPLDNGLYMETVIGNAPSSSGSRATFNTVVEKGTTLGILIYNKSNHEFQGMITGTVGEGGAVIMDEPQTPLRLNIGQYQLTCVSPKQFAGSNGSIMASYFGYNSMYGETTVTVSPNESQYKADFQLSHMNGRLDITVKSNNVGAIANLTSYLYGEKWPMYTIYNYTEGNWMQAPTFHMQLNGWSVIEDASGNSEVKGGTYLVDDDYSLSNEAKLVFKSGTVGSTNLTNREVSLPNLKGKINQITRATITIKNKANYTVTFAAGANGSVSPTTASGVEGTIATSTATPADGYQFAYWKNQSGDKVSSEATISRTLGASENGKTYTAVFDEKNPFGRLELAVFDLAYDRATGKNKFADDRAFWYDADRDGYEGDLYTWNTRNPYIDTGMCSGNWETANDPCRDLGNGWRMPTTDDTAILIQAQVYPSSNQSWYYVQMADGANNQFLCGKYETATITGQNVATHTKAEKLWIAWVNGNESYIPRRDPWRAPSFMFLGHVNVAGDNVYQGNCIGRFSMAGSNEGSYFFKRAHIRCVRDKY